MRNRKPGATIAGMRRLVVIALALTAAACQRREPAGRVQPQQRQAVSGREQVGREQAARERAAYDRYRQPEQIIAGLGLRPGMRVADTGAGHGYLTTRLAAAVGPTGHVVATDVDDAALATIPLAPTIETRLVQPNDPGLEPHGFDRILVAEVDHYLPDRAAWLGKLKGALRPGGYIIVTNRRGFLPLVVAAATSAGYATTELPLDLPNHFYLRLEPN
jgi:2-polyprenyl-3-methyl-5-hydroxy-6-metoxy-1,4-benzoquinol methylase